MTDPATLGPLQCEWVGGPYDGVTVWLRNPDPVAVAIRRDRPDMMITEGVAFDVYEVTPTTTEHGWRLMWADRRLTTWQEGAP